MQNARTVRVQTLVAVLACATACASPAWAAVPVGGVYVATLPADAEVWLDGTYVGRSPVLVGGLAAGRHALTIVKSGWSLLELPVEIAPGRTIVSGNVLAASGAPAGAGTLVIRALPPRAAVDVDGSPSVAVVGRPIALAAGTHRLSVDVAGSRMTRTIAIVPGTATQVVLAMPRAAPSATPSAVVAPASDYLPSDAVTLHPDRIVVRYAGHVAVAHYGDPVVVLDGAKVVYTSAAEEIGGKLYLPLALLEKLSAETAK